MRRHSRTKIIVRTLQRLGLGLFLLFVTLFLSLYTRAGGYARVYAATSSQLSFQARLQSSGGSLVPDGTYSIQFKLYNTSSGGAAEWTETDSVSVKGGYFNVYLGAGSAFPSTIDWTADHWVTMNINGDGEMNPRIQLTAVPYAFRAGQADGLTNGSSTLTANQITQLAPSSMQAVNSALTLLQLNQTGSGALVQLQHNGSDAFTLAANGDLVTTGSGAFRGGTLEIGSATLTGGLVLNDGGGKKATLKAATLGQDTLYTLPDPGAATATICLSIGNCAGSGDIRNGGNGTGSTVSIGTTDNNALAFLTNGQQRVLIDSLGRVGIGTNGTLSTLLAIGGTSGNFTVNSSGAVTAAGLNNGSGGITNAGSITGIGTNLTAAAGLTVASSGSGSLTLNSASGTAVLGATTLQTTDNLGLDLSKATDTTLTISNSGAGVASLNLADGALQVAGTTVLTNARLLQNVTASTGILTSGTLGTARGGTGLDGSGATNGQMLIGNGSGFSLGSLANNGGLTVTAGAGTLGLSVNYGSTSITAVRGDTGLTCASGTGNLSGGGTSITLGAGGTCAALDTKAAVSFGTSVTTPLVTNSGGLSVNTADSTSANTGAITIKSGNASTGTNLSAGTVTIDTGTKTGAGTGTINLGNSNATSLVIGNSGTAVSLNGSSLTFGTGLSSWSRTAAGTTAFDLVDTADTTFAFTNSGTGRLNLTADGSITAGNGLVAGAGGASISGTSNISGALTINSSANNNVDVNTGTSTGTVTIGGGSTPLVINSSAFDVSSAGALSGISGYMQGSGNFAISGSGTFATASGAISLNGATTVATSTNGATALTINGTTGTAATALNVVQTGDAANVTLSNTARTSGALISLTQSTSSFTGTGLLLNFASGSGSFSAGAFADFQLNGVSKFKVDNTGGLTISTNSTAALSVKSTGAVSYLNIDTTGTSVQIGSSSADANAILLVLDSYNGASDPTGVLGAEYYSTSNNSRRCFENGYWSDCSTTRIQSDVTLAGAGSTVSLTLAGTETSLSCHLSSTGRSTNSLIYLRFNNVSSAGAYSYNVLQNLTGASNNTTPVSSGSATQIILNGSSSGTNPGSYNLWINNFTSTNKTVDWTGAGSDAAGSVPNNFKGSGTYFNTSTQITSVQFIASAGNFNAGTRAWCDGR